MGAIVDSTRAYEIGQYKQMVHLKILDMMSTEVESLHVQMFGYSPNDLPKVTALGDIIYLKRVKV